MIQSGEGVTTGIGSSGELDEEGREQIVEILLVDVPEVEIEIGHRGLPIIVQGHDILNDRGAVFIM
jgi:hypothetical protein